MPDIFVVDTPDLVDAIQRASRIAPKRGHAFDIAAGLMISCGEGKVVIKASDLDTNYRQAIPLKDGDFAPFRVPSAILSNWIGHLPTGESSQIEVRVEGSFVSLASETSKAKFALIESDSFPEFDEFDPSGLVEVENLGNRLRQVSWACHRDSVPLSGIHMDGEFLVGCDQARMAEVSCEVPVDEPVTAPLSGVASALRGHRGPVGMAVSDKKLYLAPDFDTQITTNLYEAAYPNLSTLRKMVERNQFTTVLSEVLTNSLARINSLCASERYPIVEMTLDGTSMRLAAHIDMLGEVEELLEFETGLGGDRITLKFTPTTLADIANAGQSPTLNIGWPEDLSPLKPLHVTDGQGFNCIAMPRR